MTDSGKGKSDAVALIAFNIILASCRSYFSYIINSTFEYADKVQ